jgi:hypothetical protein
MAGGVKPNKNNFVKEIIQRSAEYWIEKGFSPGANKKPLGTMTNVELADYVAELETRLNDAEATIKDILKRGTTAMRTGPDTHK